MKFRKFFLCALATAIAFAGVSLAQTSQKSRLTPKFDFSPIRAAARTAAPLAQPAGTPSLPIWSFSVRSSRDGNQYTGVMVGSNPFHEDSHSTQIKTQIIPIIFKTHTVGTTVNAQGIIATAPGDTTFNPTVPDHACLGSRNNNPLRLFQQSPIFNPADFNYGRTGVGFTTD